MRRLKILQETFRRSETFRQMFITLFIIFLLPFFLLVIFSQAAYSRHFSQESENLYASQLSSFRFFTSQVDHTFGSIVNQLQYDRSIATAYTPKDALAAQELISKLQSYSSSQQYVSDVWYYCEGDDYLFSSKTSNSIPFFCDKHYRIDRMDEASFTSFLGSNRTNTVLSATDLQQHERVFLFVFPLIHSAQAEFDYHQIIFTISEDWLRSMTIPQSLSAAALVTYNDQILCFSGESVLTQIEAQEILTSYPLSASRNEQQDILLGTARLSDGNALKIYSTDTPGESWNLYLFVENAFVFQNSKIIILHLILASLLSSGLLICLLLTKKIYFPLEKLREKVDILSQNAAHQEIENDYRYIDTKISMLIQKQQVLNDQISENAFAVEKIFSHNLLHNYYETGEKYNLLAEPFQLSFPHNSFLVFTILFSTEDMAANILKMKAIMKGNDWRILFSGITDVPSGILGIVSLSPDSHDSFRQSAQRLFSEFQEIIAVGIGNAYGSIDQIPISYLQSLCACNRAAAGTICHFYGEAASEIPQENPLRFCRELKERLEMCETSPQDSVTEMISIIEATLPLIEQFPTVSSGCINSSAAFLSPALIFLYDRHIGLSPLLDCICHCENFLLADTEATPILKMTQYIQANFTDPNFSLKLMAAHFSMSEPALCSYYKKQLGKSILDDVTELKIQEAMALLKNTNLSISEISNAVGYSNVNSFIRRFKQIHGITPGNYRKQ